MTPTLLTLADVKAALASRDRGPISLTWLTLTTFGVMLDALAAGTLKSAAGLRNALYASTSRQRFLLDREGAAMLLGITAAQFERDVEPLLWSRPSELSWPIEDVANVVDTIVRRLGHYPYGPRHTPGSRPARMRTERFPYAGHSHPSRRGPRE
jgi:hypothetical protein